MATINLKSNLEVAPDELWARVKNVGAVSDLLNVITESSLDGDKRHCTMADGGLLEETILSVDEDHRRVAYTITSGPFPVEAHASSMQVSAAGDGKSTLQWITDIKPDELAGALGPMLTAEMGQLEQHYNA
ncbi:SRPBCC family protein [Nocardioides sp.]|uniref:SRPBCC family protein n=1 Tax=Nocardioides sp. TaxID=35761 RepID=UPI0035613E1C